MNRGPCPSGGICEDTVRNIFKKYLDDWTVLKYGWLAVFIIHIAYLAVGVFWLKRALRMEHAELFTIPEVRLSYAMTAAHMITIAFSTILLIMTVFIFEIFKMTRRLARDVEDIREFVGAPAAPNGMERPASDNSADQDVGCVESEVLMGAHAETETADEPS